MVRLKVNVDRAFHEACKSGGGGVGAIVEDEWGGCGAALLWSISFYTLSQPLQVNGGRGYESWYLCSLPSCHCFWVLT